MKSYYLGVKCYRVNNSSTLFCLEKTKGKYFTENELVMFDKGRCTVYKNGDVSFINLDDSVEKMKHELFNFINFYDYVSTRIFYIIEERYSRVLYK